jgi:hypothetical protein
VASSLRFSPEGVTPRRTSARLASGAARSTI